jgi:hypothetical protein
MWRHWGPNGRPTTDDKMAVPRHLTRKCHNRAAAGLTLSRREDAIFSQCTVTPSRLGANDGFVRRWIPNAAPLDMNASSVDKVRVASAPPRARVTLHQCLDLGIENHIILTKGSTARQHVTPPSSSTPKAATRRRTFPAPTHHLPSQPVTRVSCMSRGEAHLEDRGYEGDKSWC